MKFHSWDTYPKFVPKCNTQDELQTYITALSKNPKIKNLPTNEYKMHLSLGGCVAAWKFDRRPYYSIYPKIVDSLIKTPLTVACKDLKFPTPANTLLLRLARGHELDGIIKTIFISTVCEETNTHNKIIFMLMERMDTNYEVALLSGRPDCTLEELITEKSQFSVDDSVVGVTEDGWEKHTAMGMRLSLGVALLDQDPEVIRPDVLERDRSRLDETIDPAVMQRLMDRAHQRGKVGWVIGECTDTESTREVAAHYRRGHWGFRWAGPGKSRLKWTKIKGSIVRRDKMTEVPTGYLDDEQSTNRKE